MVTFGGVRSTKRDVARRVTLVRGNLAAGAVLEFISSMPQFSMKYIPPSPTPPILIIWAWVENEAAARDRIAPTLCHLK